MNQFADYFNTNYHPMLTVVSRGDFSSDNLVVNDEDKGLLEAKKPDQLTGKISSIDSRYWATDVDFDPVHASFSPCFNEFDRNIVIQHIINGLDRLYEFKHPEMAEENFNAMYPLIGTGIAAHYHSNGDIENAAKILHKVLDFSRDKPFIDKFWLYLNDSKAKPLLKII
jgi:hypothetical protein